MANGLNYNSSNVLSFTTNDVKREVIDASGNHGFGVLSPTNLVDISGSTSTPLRVRGLASGSDGRILATNENGVVSYRSDVLVGGSISNNVVTLTDVDGDTSNLTVQAVTAVTYSSAYDIALDGTGTIGSTPVALPFITGGTYSSGTITLGINDGLESNISITGIDGDDTFVTGGTLSSGSLTLGLNDGTSASAVTGFGVSVAGDLTFSTVNLGGTISVLGGTGVSTSESSGAITVNLANTSVTAGNYGSASETVTLQIDAQGRITSASEQTISITSSEVSDFTTASETAIFTDANFVDSTEIDFTVSAGASVTAGIKNTSITNDMLAGSIANGKLSNSGFSTAGTTGTGTISLGDTITFASTDGSVTISDNGSGTFDIEVGTGVDTFVTGGTFTSGTLSLELNDGSTAQNITGLWTSIPNSALANSSVTIGSTSIALGATGATLAGLTSVTSTSFVGDLTGDVTGNADTADAWSSQMTLTLGTDLSGNVSFDGSAGVTLNASLGAGVVDTAELANASVTNDKLAGSIANAKLVNSKIVVSDGTTDSDINLGDTLTIAGGTGIDSSNTSGTVTLSIDNTVVTTTGSQTLTNKVINGSQLVDGSVTNAKLDNSSFTIQGDTGTNQTISLGDTFRLSGGTGVQTIGVSTDELHITIDTSTIQVTSEKGQADGYASLDSNGKVPASQLPSSVFEYKGKWDASTNTPTLADGTGDAGDAYRVATGGTQNLGSGNITFTVGDLVIYDGAEWQRVDGDDAVDSVNGQTGVVVLDADDISDSGTTNKWDQTVAFTGDGITIGGTYPNFTLTNSDKGSSQNIFKTISVPTGTAPVADSNSDTLSLISSDSSVSISGNSTTDTIDIKVDTSTITNFYTENGTLSGNRTVTQSGNSLAFTGGDFTVDGTTFSVDESESSVGIGVAAPDASAVLEVASTSKGFLFPRMTESQRGNISSAATGLMVYQTDGDEGVYIKKSFGWVQVI